MVQQFHKTDQTNRRIGKTINITFHTFWNQRELALPLSIILIITALLYARTLQNGILSWDDMRHITYNKDIQTLSVDNIKKIFTSSYNGMYHPSVTLSFALEYQLFGLNSAVYHATNLLFHIVNIVLVFFFVYRVSNQRLPALIAACLFGIHPMHVESIAWITERKDVVYAFFYLLALIYYLRFINGNNKKYLWLTLLFFTFSLLSKSTAITLPLILFLIDYYFHRKIKGRTLIEKIPFIVLSLIFCVVTFYSQGSSISNRVLQTFNLTDRIFLVSYSICYYLFSIVMPVHLSAFHLFPEKLNGSLPLEYYLAVIPIILLATVIFYKGAFHREIVFGILFFIFILSPNTHIIPFGHAIVAERYAYLPYVGMYFLLGQLFTRFMDRYKEFQLWKKSAWIMAILALTCLGYATYQRIGVWRDTRTLFNDASAKASDIKGATWLQGFGYELDAEERSNALAYTTAIQYYDTAITLNPYKAKPYNDRGYLKHVLEDYEGAMKDYSKAIELNPSYIPAYVNRALIYLMWNKQQEACSDVKKAYSLGLREAYALIPVNCPP